LNPVTNQPKSGSDSARLPGVTSLWQIARSSTPFRLPGQSLRLMAADIRPARATDVDALSAIENAVFASDRISPRSLGRLFRSASASVLVATVGDVVVGYLVLLFRAGSSRARLYSIAIAPQQAGRGLGKALLAAAEREAERRAAASLRLEVRADNSRAVCLYERNGYRQFGRLDSYYADGAAALRFEKVLSSKKRPKPIAARSARPSGTAPS
jgi:ribosomal-protein-alanine acetyltransferase